MKNRRYLFFLSHISSFLLFLCVDYLSIEKVRANVDNQSVSQLAKAPEYTGVAKKVDEIAQQITVRIDSRDRGNGSGVIVAKEGNIYYVLTADHVVKNPDEYEIVTPDGKRHRVNNETVKTFEGVDLALLQFTSQESYSIATLADYQLGLDELSQGKQQLIFLSGFPGSKLGNNQNLSRKLTAGIAFPQIFALSLAQNVYSLNNGYELVYTNLSQPGMSGGPLLDSLGRVVGINAAAEAELEVNSAGQVEEINLGRSLGVPIR
jgi:S1-C subfamily serine protease